MFNLDYSGWNVDMFKHVICDTDLEAERKIFVSGGAFCDKLLWTRVKDGNGFLLKIAIGLSTTREA